MRISIIIFLILYVVSKIGYCALWLTFETRSAPQLLILSHNTWEFMLIILISIVALKHLKK